MKGSMLSNTILIVVLVSLSFPVIVSTHGAMNATQNYNVSDDVNFHYMVVLWQQKETNDDYYTSNKQSYLSFYWNAPVYSNTVGKIVQCKMVYKAKSNSSELPSYLALGIQDFDKIQSNGKDKMIGADAIIGSLNDSVTQYALNGAYEGEGGVEQVPPSTKNKFPLYLESESKIIQKDDHTVMFDITLFVDENPSKQGSRKSIKESGENLFLFAIGPTTPSGNNYLGTHASAGSFVLNFDKVGTSKERSYASEPRKNCASDDIDYEKMIQLKSKVKFYWTLDKENDLLKAQLKHLGNSWLALGVAENENGRMVGADAIIGRPALSLADGEAPLKYHLYSKQQNGIVPMKASKQTLMDAFLLQDDDETILQFTKRLEEQDENPISKTDATTFIYAVGATNILSYHSYAESFNIDLTSCPIESNIRSASFKSSWIAHGFFASLAFAIVMPISISSAFLRQLIPSSWIYLHVYGNLLMFALILVTVFIAISNMSMSGDQHFTESHHKIGLTLLILSFIQVMNGVFRPNKGYSQLPYERKQRESWKLFHRSLGITLFCLGLFQVGDGLNMFSQDYGSINLAPVYFVCLTIITIIVLGAKLWLFVSGEGERSFGDNDLDIEVYENGARRPETELT